MGEYNILVKDVNNQNIGEFETFTSLTFGKKLNDYASCELVLPFNNSKLADLVALRRNSIWIYDGGTLVWSGEMAMRRGSLDDRGAGMVHVYAYDWLEQLRHKITGASVEFLQVDAGQIAWELINSAQTGTNASVGITEGTIEETMDRDRHYYNDNVMEEIINLSNVLNGFDFEVNNNKVFNVYASKGEDLTESLILRYGDNIKSCTITEDFTFPTNRAIVIGETTDNNLINRVVRNNTTSQALYKIREQKSAEINVTELDTLQEKGDAMLRKYEFPLLKVDIELAAGVPSIKEFAVGDYLGLSIEKGIYNINDVYRVYEWEVQRGVNDYNQLSLLLGRFNI